MIQYLVDSSAVWRLMRDHTLAASLDELLAGAAVGSCEPQRVEFRRSARSVDEFDEMNQTFVDLYPDVPVPKLAWRWIESAQFKLARVGAHRAMSLTDLLVCATAAHAGLAVLHDDNDFVTAARHLDDVREQRIHGL